MNETKITQLKQQVQASNILSEQERQEWILMLPIMNDKQMADLETILHSPASAPPKIAPESSPAKPVAASVPQMQMPTQRPPEKVVPTQQPQPHLQPQQASSFMPPKLTHIANVPAAVVKSAAHNPATNGNANMHSPAAPQSPLNRPATKAAWDQEIKRELTEPELPAPKQQQPKPVGPPPQHPAQHSVAPSISQLSPLIAKTVSPPQPPPPPKPAGGNPIAPAMPTVKSASQPPKPESTPQPQVRHDDFWSALLEPKRAQVYADVATAVREGRVSSGPVITKIHNLADVSLLSLQSLEQMTAKVLIGTLQKMVQDEGYEYVVAAFEKSPLYRVYLTAGSLALEKNMTFEQLSVSKSAEDLPLTRSEFEMIVDVLKHMQVN